MDALCLIVAGVLRTTLPTQEFSLEWRHSVEKTRWRERYLIAADTLVLAEAAVEGNGAGMQPPPEAIFADGRWTWRPALRLPRVVVAASPYGGDYRLCTANGCKSLHEWLGSDMTGAVELRACSSG